MAKLRTAMRPVGAALLLLLVVCTAVAEGHGHGRKCHHKAHKKFSVENMVCAPHSPKPQGQTGSCLPSPPHAWAA